MSRIKRDALAVLDRGPAGAAEVAERIQWHGWKHLFLTGRIYPVMRSLVADGYATCDETERVAERGWRPCFIYSITAAGREAVMRAGR